MAALPASAALPPMSGVNDSKNTSAKTEGYPATLRYTVNAGYAQLDIYEPIPAEHLPKVRFVVAYGMDPKMPESDFIADRHGCSNKKETLLSTLNAYFDERDEIAVVDVAVIDLPFLYPVRETRMVKALVREYDTSYYQADYEQRENAEKAKLEAEIAELEAYTPATEAHEWQIEERLTALRAKVDGLEARYENLRNAYAAEMKEAARPRSRSPARAAIPPMSTATEQAVLAKQNQDRKVKVEKAKEQLQAMYEANLKKLEAMKVNDLKAATVAVEAAYVALAEKVREASRYTPYAELDAELAKIIATARDGDFAGYQHTVHARDVKIKRACEELDKRWLVELAKLEKQEQYAMLDAAILRVSRVSANNAELKERNRQIAEIAAAKVELKQWYQARYTKAVQACGDGVDALLKDLLNTIAEAPTIVKLPS